MGYLTFWKLPKKPFEEVCNIRFFFESDDHRGAPDRMLNLVNERNMNMGLLTGEAGCGKTEPYPVLDECRTLFQKD